MTDDFDPTSKPLTTLVMKFGGTSVGSSAAMRQVIDIVRQTRAQIPRVVVVTSAMAKVTNLLLEGANQAALGEINTASLASENLRAIHHTVSQELIHQPSQRTEVDYEIDGLIDHFCSLCEAISVLGEATPRALDAVASLGERMSVRLLTAILNSAGISSKFLEATQLIVTDSHFQDAHPNFEASAILSRQNINPVLDQGLVPVITGFIAADEVGLTTTLGRGGSDYSAAIIGAVLPAEDVWIWTDVDGVMSADPRLVPAARTIPELTYREVAELAYYGAKVLHPKTIRPVLEAGIGLRICNTFNPSHPGTRLIEDKTEQSNSVRGSIKAVTAIGGQRLVTVEGRGMLGVPGVAARAFGAVASTGTSVPLITQSSSEQSICFAVPSEAAQVVIDALHQVFTRELSIRDIDRIWATEEVAIITIVGAGMIHTPGIAGRIFSRLGQNDINVIAIAQGSSEVSISLVVSGVETQAALTCLHDLTNGSEKPG